MPLDEDTVQAVPDNGMQMKKRAPRYRNLMFTQQVKYLKPPYDSLDAMVNLVEKQGVERFGAILHDKDTGEAPHIHIFMHFKHPREIDPLAKQLYVQPQYIHKWNENESNGYLYLCHRTQSAQQKGDFQYDPAEVKASFDYADWLPTAEMEYKLAQEKKSKRPVSNSTLNDPVFLLDSLYIGAIPREEVEARLTGSQYARYHRQIEDICAKRQRDRADKWREEMRAKGGQVQTIWIYGPAGTGKTSLAKDYAAKRGQPYFVAGSSRDTFQTYSGQHTLILDELRPETIPYHDLLRITDPFGAVDEVMAPSRYVDKALACDLIIITTPYSPHQFYKIMFPYPERTDSFDQLHRRISLTLCLLDQAINAMEYTCITDTNGFGIYHYCPIPGATQPNPYSQTNRQTTVTQPLDLFHAMFQ